MAEDGIFKPLPGAGPRQKASAAAADPWQPIQPVPADAPPEPPQHRRRGKPSRRWAYRNAVGQLLGYVLRYDLADGTKEFAPATYCQNATTGTSEWRFKGFPAPRPLYGLDRLGQRPSATVIVCEGEKACDAAGELLPDHVVVTSPNGAKSASKADWSALRGRNVILWPDNDDEGRSYAAAIARALHSVAASVKIARAPSGAAEKWDAADALAEGWDRSKAEALMAGAVPGNGAALDAGNGTGRRRRQSDNLLDFLPDIELWHSPDRDAFATFKVGAHYENWPVRSKDFREWLSGRYFLATGAAPGNQAMEDTLRIVEGRAKHDGAEHPVFLRIAGHDEKVFVDLADAQWRSVEITAEGWQVIDRPPVKFIRSASMRALPAPEIGGLIEHELRDLVNLRNESDFKLIVGWLVECFNPHGPCPILAISGEQGSAKSSLCRLLRALTDPNTAPIRLPPHNEDDLIVTARNSWVLAFDNVSDVASWMSDALCSLATGAGFATREHYSNTNEVIFEGARPIMLNGIPDFGSRPDFADRTVHVVLKPIAEADRRPEEELRREIKARLPLILGALLIAVAGALRHRGEVPRVLTRMADFVVWVSAAETALGWEKGDFVTAYVGNREGQVEAALEADPLSDAVAQLVESDDWSGSPTELLARLGEKVSDAVRKGRSWPAPNKLRSRLRRLATALREKGIFLDLDERANDAARTRVIGIRRNRAPLQLGV
jgi:putative DNA primase/helicase